LTDIGSGHIVREFAPLARRAHLTAAFTPDGERFVTFRGRTVDVWEAHSGQHIGQLHGQRASLQTDAESVNDSSLSASDRTGGPSDLTVGIAALREDPDDGGEVDRGGFVISADGRYMLTASRDAESAQLWDLHTARLSRTMTGHSGLLNAIGFTPDSRTAITIGEEDSTVRLWKLAS
jgi:hypothetical protein